MTKELCNTEDLEGKETDTLKEKWEKKKDYTWRNGEKENKEKKEERAGT